MLGARDIVVKPLSGISPEQARDARARAWASVFECWHAKKGGSHDLTNGSTADMAKHGPRKTEQENT